MMRCEGTPRRVSSLQWLTFITYLCAGIGYSGFQPEKKKWGMQMDRRNLLKALAGLAICPACTSAGFAAEGTHWSYEGGAGPAKWGDLEAANQACSIGSPQSPIDIGPTIKSQLPTLKLSWGRSADTIVNNGHTIQLNFAEGSTLKLGDTT